MSDTSAEPTSSMGNDAPLAVFSDKPKRLFEYFKQMFAQVTNPPIDSIREGLVMALQIILGHSVQIF
jgi:glutamate synthase (NADPH) large chain